MYYMMNFEESNAPSSDDSLACIILVQSELSKNEIETIMKEVDDIKNHDPFDDVDESEWDTVEKNPYMDLGWDEAIFRILRDHFSDKVTIIDENHVKTVKGFVN